MNKKVLLLLIISLIVGYYLYDQVFLPSSSDGETMVTLNIPKDATLESVTELVVGKSLVRNKWLFNFIAKRKNYDQRIQPGSFKVPQDISINDLVNQLRMGARKVVKFTFNNIYSLHELAGKAAATLDADSVDFVQALEDSSAREHFGFSKENYPTMFIPNTYEFNSNTSPEQFVERMAREFKNFWNEDRTKKMKDLNLTYSEVVTLASITQAEQQANPDEWKRIAGLYLNRVRQGMPLQSDPTIKFAAGNWKMSRILNKHLQIDSPYNTYLYAGIPPGPILFPDIKAVDAVLDAERHSYLYMCAKADFSGRHEFSKTLSIHNKHAAAWRQALNDRNIYN